VVRRLVVAEGIFIALASCLVATIPALVLTAAIDAGVGNLMLNVPLPFRIAAPAIVIWVVAVVVGAALATLAAAVRASRLTVHEPRSVRVTELTVAQPGGGDPTKQRSIAR
jgi:putative ABC transport system permease protein